MADLPGVKSIIQDYGLNVSPEPQILNDSILIIGTASDGPMYDPIPILNKDQATAVFGSFGAGTLVRGIYESMDATIEGTPDIRGMRVGNGQKSVLEVDERTTTSSSWDTPTTGRKSLKLQAVYPGSKYNAVSVFQDENKKINIYNPKTGKYSTFTYDDTNPNNTSVDARNVQELVDAINADANTSAAMVASTSGISTQFEVSGITTASSGVSSVAGRAILDLKWMLNGYPTTTNVRATGYVFTTNTSATAGNLISELEEIFALSVSRPTLLETRGSTSVTVTLSPFDGKGDSRFDTIQAMEDYDSDNIFFHKPSGGGVISEYMSYLDREVLPDVTTLTSGLLSWTQDYAVAGWFQAPDDSQEEIGSDASGIIFTVTDKDGNAGTTTLAKYPCIALAAVRASSGSYYGATNGYVGGIFDDIDASGADYQRCTASGIAGYLTNPGKVIIEVSETGGASDSEWSECFYHPISGIYVSGFNVAGGTGTATLAIGSNATGYTGTGNLVAANLISSGAVIQADRYIRISCNTVKGFLSEAESLPNLEGASSDWLTYFFRGKEVIFSNTVPFDTIVNYGTKVNFEPGSDVVITDAHNGQIKFVSDTQPGPSGGTLDPSLGTIIGLKYKHLPQFPAITTAALSLDGGSDGTEISNATLYDEFATAYDYLENYDVNVVVPIGANLDATRNGFNAITGIEEITNAQFQVQLQEFLEKVSEDVNETVGVMGVEQADTNRLNDVKTWVKRLTVQDLSDPTRGANIMPLLDTRHISVCAFEPVFDNLGGLPYTANGQASYAGMVSSLEPHYSPTNKSIPNALRTRFDLSNSQLEALSDMRYVSMRKKSGRRPVITDAMTAAATGSDFVRLTTVRITFAAMDVVRKVCDPFIGQPNDQAKRNAMEAAITRGLSQMVEAGALRKYAFTISSSPTQQVLGRVNIDLILVPIFEIRSIRTTVKLRTEIPTAS